MGCSEDMVEQGVKQYIYIHLGSALQLERGKWLTASMNMPQIRSIMAFMYNLP